MSSAIISPAERLNRDCDCVGTDVPTLRADLGDTLDTHPHLFSDAPVFIDAGHVAQMRALIDAVQATSRLPGFRAAALAAAPPIAQVEPRALGVFTGFDFHLGTAGPRLIEINTNAGGALLNAVARNAQRSCCPATDAALEAQPDAKSLQQRFVEMFRAEWLLARDAPRRLCTIAIVDDEPQLQYLYPEFRLFQRLFESCGIEAFIADAGELQVSATGLEHRGRHIDLVYNRLTDFYFQAPNHQALRQAYEADLAVITPHPRAHALLADKRNLVLLSDVSFLRSIGADPRGIETLLRFIPRTLLVADCAERWWAERKDWFFKPTQGYGSRGTYRGDKITKRVFAEVMRGNYVAQELAPPSERQRAGLAGRATFKLDIRNYTYDGATQLLAARLYQGQTTNFRTAGGGFAPVYQLEVVPEGEKWEVPKLVPGGT
jgi:hypothetical protein